jgi:hypothetical protein
MLELVLKKVLGKMKNCAFWLAKIATVIGYAKIGLLK